MSNDIQLGIKLRFDGKDVSGGVTIAREDFRKLAVDAKQAAEAMSGGFSSAARGVRSVSDMLAQTRNLGVGIFSIRELAQASDAYTNLASRIALVSPSARESAQAMAQVYAIAQQSGQSLAAIGDVYQKIARNALQYSLSAADVAKTTGAIANAVKLSGGTAESTSAALMQLGQALASGTLRGEELNSVMEQTPALAEAIARGMGKTVGDLRRLGEAGQLAAKDVLAAITSEAKRLETEVARLTPTIGQAVQQLNNAFSQWAGGNNSAAGKAVASGISGIASNFNGLADAALIAGGALAGMKLAGWVKDALAAASAAGGIGLAIAQMNPVVRGVTLAVGALTAAWVAWQRASQNSTLPNMADEAQRTAQALGKVAAEIRNVSYATAQARLKQAEGERGDIDRAIAEKARRVETIQNAGGKGDAALLNRLQDDILLLGKRRHELDASIKSLAQAMPDAGSSGVESFTKNADFMTKARKATEELSKAGETYVKAWQAAANLPPDKIESTRSALLAQYQALIAEKQGAGKKEGKAAERRANPYDEFAATLEKEGAKGQKEVDDFAFRVGERVTQINQKIAELGQSPEQSQRIRALAEIDKEFERAAKRINETHKNDAVARNESLAALEKWRDEAKGQTSEALDQLKAKTDALNASWGHGATIALRDYLKEVQNTAQQSERFFANSFRGMEDALTKFFETGKFEAQDFTRVLQHEAAKWAAQQTIASFTGGSSGGGGFDFLAAADLLINGFAKGDVFTSPDLHQYVNTILSSPTLFKFAKGGAFGVGGEAGPEAIMPLTRGADGNLGVRAHGSGGGVSVAIYDQRSAATAAPVEIDQGVGPDGSTQLRIWLRDEMRGQVKSGALDRVMRDRYGSQPTVTRR